MNPMKKIITILIFSASQGVFAQCSDLFISEYIEGSSNNKALEIYNPTASTIDLTDYVVHRYTNGAATPTASFYPLGTLSAGDVFVIANSSAATEILNVSDTVHSLITFNGNDAVELVKISTSATLDIIGEIGFDPGASWSVGTGATADNTLVRMSSIQQGSSSWATNASQWDVYSMDTYTYLGSHTMDPCTSSIDEYKSDVLSVYPNPANDELNILSYETDLDYEIVDIEGRTVLSGALSYGSSKVSVGSLIEGIYFVRLKGKSDVVKFLKN